ncbi:unnamed protein product [Tilletia caries]|uniref:Uncharacterized protein n=1 Tax=Tilletia caries TaxID=13290 RepID=A0ABN7J2W8_9BASI|nr:unnamed protein product [Tilletia caries]
MTPGDCRKISPRSPHSAQAHFISTATATATTRRTASARTTTSRTQGYYQFKAFHFPTPARPAAHQDQLIPEQPPLHPHLCEYIPELAHCDDIALHKPSGNAYFACDDTRLWRDPLRLLWDEPPGQGQGAFHPAGLTVTTANTSQYNSSKPDALLLLVSNHPVPSQPGVVDVLVHNLTTTATSDVLRHHRRLDASHFHANWRGSSDKIAKEDGRDSRIEDREAGPQLSPWRLSVFLEQQSPPLPADNSKTDHSLSLTIPSFLFSSAPSLPSSSNTNQTALHDASSAFTHLALPTISEYLTEVFLPSHSTRAHIRALKPPAHIYTYLANGAVSVPAADGTLSLPTTGVASSPSSLALPGYPPIPRAWDGGGLTGGRNHSAAVVFVLANQGTKSLLVEYEQHWVRPVGALLRFFIEQPLYSAAKRLWWGGDGAVSVWKGREVAGVYTPQYVTFVSQGFGGVQGAFAHDSLGRFWTVGAEGGMEAARSWLRHLYAVLSSRQKGEGRATRPGTRITQVTHLYRHGPSVAHPWELDRLKRPREEGMFLPKEFYPTPIFRTSPSSDAVGQWEPLVIQPAGNGSTEKGPVRRVAKQLGFLPTLPTGLEVDHERGWVLVSSVWDERGAARCEIPKGWAER